MIILLVYQCFSVGNYSKSNISRETSDWIDIDTFLDNHHFVQLLTQDFIESIMIFHDDSKMLNQHSKIESSAMSLKIDMGLCCVYGCIDSIDKLSVSLYFAGFCSLLL